MLRKFRLKQKKKWFSCKKTCMNKKRVHGSVSCIVIRQLFPKAIDLLHKILSRHIYDI